MAIKWLNHEICAPDKKYKADGEENCIGSSLLLLLLVVWHPHLLQEEVDLDVDDGDHNKRKIELEDPGENCVPDQEFGVTQLSQ